MWKKLSEITLPHTSLRLNLLVICEMVLLLLFTQVHMAEDNIIVQRKALNVNIVPNVGDIIQILMPIGGTTVMKRTTISVDPYT